MESEYIAASDSTREAVWLRRLLDDLGEQQREPTLLRCDNESAIGLAYNPLAHKGSKHIEVRYHYIREQVTCGNVEVVHVRTQNQFADVLTKAVDGETYLNFLAGFGLCEVPQVWSDSRPYNEFTTLFVLQDLIKKFLIWRNLSRLIFLFTF